MNRSIFIALLLIPCGIFAADRLLSTPDGGGKEKKTELKQEAKAEPADVTEAAQTAETVKEQEIVSLDQASLTEPEKEAKSAEKTEINKPATKPSAKTDQISNYASALEKQFKAFEEGEHNPLHESYLVNPKWSEAVEEGLKSKMEDFRMRIAKIDPMKMKSERMFSRCPSGYAVNLVALENEDFEPEQLTGEGIIFAMEGCWDRTIAMFKYGENGSDIQVKISEEIGYVDAETFLKILGQANLNMRS